MHTLDTIRLKECREKLGITKQEAAKRINVSQPTYLRYESGQRTPSIQVIQEMALAFNTSTDYLTGVSNNTSPETLLIRKKEDPELFELINIYRKSSSMQKEHLLSYLKNFTENK